MTDSYANRRLSLYRFHQAPKVMEPKRVLTWLD